jgi:hypothetical protein
MNTIEEQYEKLCAEAESNFNTLSKEVIWLRVTWFNYCQLFLIDENKATLWEASEITCVIFDELFVDNFIMTISRLTDKKQTGKNKNSTIERLADDLKELLLEKYDAIRFPCTEQPSEGFLTIEDELKDIQLQSEVRGYYTNEEADRASFLWEIIRKKTYFREKYNTALIEIDSLLTELDKCTKSIRTIRDKKKGHRDLNTAIAEYQQHHKNNTENGLNVTYQNIKKSIEVIWDILKIFYLHLQSSCSDCLPIMPPKDINRFIRIIELGNNKFNEEMKSVQ